MLLRFLLPVIILGIAVAGAAALVKSKPEAEPIVSEEKAWLVEAVDVKRADHRPTLVLYGRVETPRTARLTAPITADVLTVHVFEGDRVEEGQLLVSLDDREARLLLRQREAEWAEIAAQVEIENQRHRNDEDALAREKKVLALSRRAVKRADNLAKTNVGSRSQLDTVLQEEQQRSMSVDARQTSIRGHASRVAQLEARQARAAALRDRAHLDLERTAVRAPFSGPISQVLVAVGARVQPGTALLNLFDSSALELRAQVPTQYIGAVRRALSAGQSISAAGVVEGQPVKATLQRLGAEVGRGSGGVDALFGINYGARDLPLGLTVELTVALAVEHGTFALPPQAIYGARHVYRVNAGRMERVAISRIGETQTASGTRVILRSEMLKSGDQVVSTQLPNAADGLKIKVAS